MRFSKFDTSLGATQAIYLYEAPFHLLMARENPGRGPSMRNFLSGITKRGSCPMCLVYLQLGNGVGDDWLALFDYQIELPVLFSVA